jgi:hypothetical protein
MNDKQTGQIRSTKSEIRNKFKCSKREKILNGSVLDFGFAVLGLFRISIFEFRIWKVIRECGGLASGKCPYFDFGC